MTAALPMGQPLLPRMQAFPYGQEERASTASNASGLTLSCLPGRAPAGAILRVAGTHFPRGAAATLRLIVAAGAGFEVGLAATGDEPRALRRIGAAQGPHSIDIPLPGVLRPAERALSSVVIVCPPEGGALAVSDVRLIPSGRSADGGRAGWAWQVDRWRDEAGALLRAAQEHDIRTLYISVPITGSRIAEPDQLARFVSRAAAHGVNVWAVEGDPAMVSESGRELALRRLQAIKRYQAAAGDTARLAGVQYDIEPYLLPAYATEPAHIAALWADTVSTLGAAAGSLPLDVVVPFWIRSSPAGERVLEAVSGPRRSLTVMAYRTDPEDIQAAAEPLLAWGAAHRLAVRVALEAGPLQDELTQYYRVAHSSEDSSLWKMAAGQAQLIVRLDAPGRLAQGTGYRLVREQVTPASRISFLGNATALETAIQAVQHNFRAWDSYGGLSLHGLLD